MRVPISHARADLTENMMTSMIDVVFLLLIFFLCASAGRRSESLLPADLGGGDGAPGAVQAAAPALLDEVWIAVTLGANGRPVMTLNATPYEQFAALETVLSQLAEIAPESPVVLDIGPKVPAGEMITLYDTCRRAGFETVNFNVPAAPSQPEPGRDR
jgi:biopolymer transport protein ExbD